MILILGGTTEGRAAVKILEEAGSVYFYSTKGDLQPVDLVHGIRLNGALSRESMAACCRENKIRLIIDAAHPFAAQLHETAEAVSLTLDIPVIRYERTFPARSDSFIWCRDYADAMQQLEQRQVKRLLALSGVNTISKLRPYWEKRDCLFRILDRDDSRAMAEKAGFPASHLLYYRDEYQSLDQEIAFIRSIAPDAILTKESGVSGYFPVKAEAARLLQIPLFVIRRPETPETFYRVYGEAGLRRQTERLLPGFFPLRTGFTTGSCATAAVRAALDALLTGKAEKETTITLPSGEKIVLPVFHTVINGDAATSVVIKDSGDDPDVTNKVPVSATVSLDAAAAFAAALLPHVFIPLNENQKLMLCGDDGVGRVMLPGLGLEIGGPAINSTPRHMICQEITDLLEQHPATETETIVVTIGVANGAELAKRTFNPKLGITGGISIIGTSGIVRPFSHEAFIASIRKEMEVAVALDCKHIIINSGAKSERYLKALYPDLKPQAFIHFGNYIGDTMHLAAGLQIKRLTLGIMIGKAIKLAEGHLDTHSKKVVMNKDFLQELAQTAGCSAGSGDQIRQITLARELWSCLAPADCRRFMQELLKRCYACTAPLLPETHLTILLLDENGSITQRE